MKNNTLPFLGFGLGLRPEHYQEIIQQKPVVDWFEIVSENYLVPGGKPLYYLDKISENYPVAMHGVSLSIGSSDPLDKDYLKAVKTLAERVEPAWISDHLCWTGIQGLNMHDLLPIPYTHQAIEHLVTRIHAIQNYLGRQILLENVSSYISYKGSEMSEWEFISEIANRADCYLLLDVNNVYVSAVNHGFDPLEYLNGIPLARVKQIHLAGHTHEGDYIIDTHDAPIIPPVWELYSQTIQRCGQVSTSIERDDHIPPLAELLIELEQAKKIAAHALTNNPGEGPFSSFPTGKGQFSPLPFGERAGRGEEPPTAPFPCDLATSQTLLQNHLLGKQNEIEQIINPSNNLPIHTRLGIYANAYQSRLVDSLADNYPILQRYLGAEAFAILASLYLAAHPSSYRSIRWFGDKLANYLAQTSAYPPYLSELAQFEWQLGLSFDAADETVLVTEEIARIPADTWPEMRFIPHPSLQRCDFSWTVVPLWRALSAQQNATEPSKTAEKTAWILWRNQYVNHFNSLSKEEAWAVDALINGLPFGEICQGLCEWLPEEEVGLRAASLLKGWVQAGMLAGLRQNPNLLVKKCF